MHTHLQFILLYGTTRPLDTKNIGCLSRHNITTQNFRYIFELSEKL